MRVKRFTANTMKEAIDQVKTDFGISAVILHTRRVRRRGVFGLLRRPRVEVIAAADQRGASVADRTAGRIAVPVPQATGARSRPNGPADNSHPHWSKVYAELAEIKQSLRKQDGDAQDDLAIRDHLLNQEVRADYVDELLAASLHSAQPDMVNDEMWVQESVRAKLLQGVLCTGTDEVGAGGRVHYLIGPTGVGKTTTIAKLAANYALLGKKKVALITADTYRIAAIEQLRIYAEIIGVPLEVAMTPTELTTAIDRYSDADMILIDTAGRSQKHQMQMRELKAYIGAGGDAEVHLVVSAATRMKDLVEIYESFGQVPISSFVVTKLDETSTYGLLYNVCRLTGRPLSFIANGQNVPDDIEIATPERVAELILGVNPDGSGGDPAPASP